VNVTGVNDSLGVVQLLSSDKPVSNSRLKKGTAEFHFVRPGQYYLRMFVDRNGNGKWDEGDYSSGLQPEETYYYPQKLTLKARWDITQDWNINDFPLDKQKPLEITKQKPDQNRTIKSRNAERKQGKKKK
jgi:hypothetical protein